MMDLGMLWFDDDPKADLLSKISRAADYYKHKYGEEPNLCFVHPSMIGGESTTVGQVLVCSNHSVLPHHFWIGVHQHEQLFA